MIKFEWDKTKNTSNLRKHGFDLSDAEILFRGPLIVEPDTREDYGEKRWRGLGLIGGRVVYVAFAEPAPDVVRIIS